MTARMADAQLDREIRAFLAWQSDDIGGAPAASEIELRLRDRVRPRGLAVPDSHRQQLAFALLLTGLLAVLLAVASFVASRPPLPTSVHNGWIAYSTQPGYAQTFETDWAEGGDIYVVREGVDPRLVVERGPDMKHNVCPQFSPDGSKLVYGELAGTARALVVLEVSDDGNVREWRRFTLPGTSPAAPCPRWSTNRSHIAYLESTQSGVRVVDLTGVRVPPMPGDPGGAAFTHSETDDPLLSPDGTVRAVCADDFVLVGPSDGSADRRVAKGCGYAIAAWSPDGTKLLLMSDGGRNATMTVASVTGPPTYDHIAPYIPVNGARSWPGRGDVSWQPVSR